MRLSTLPQLLLAAALAGPGTAALADPVYNITVIGGAGSAAVDINHRGDVVGHFSSGGNTRGFVYTNGGFTEIGTFGGQNSMAVAINDHGQVVGSAATPSGWNHAFLFSGGTLHDLGTLGGRYSDAYDINNQGVIVGTSDTADAPNFVFRRAFRYAGGSMSSLGTLPDGAGSDAYAINNKGLIGGAASEGLDTFPEFPSHAVLFRGGSVDLLVPLGYGDSAVYGLNDRGQAVGGIPNTTSAHGSHAFLYDGGTLIDLGPLWTGSDESIARDINNHGQVVGNAMIRIDTNHSTWHAFLYDRHGGMVDLNALIDPDSGWMITDANAINDAGQIAATACRGGVFSDCHAVRLDLVSPVPEPGGWAMLALGIGAIGLRGASRLRRPCRAGCRVCASEGS